MSRGVLIHAGGFHSRDESVLVFLYYGEREREERDSVWGGMEPK
jgi:hypothetical protein